MTRNRDDFSTFQALRTGVIGLLVIVATMVALGLAMSAHKDAADDRATTIAASALQFEATDVQVAATTTQARG